MLNTTNPFAQRPRWLAQLPRVVRVYVLSVLLGFALSALFTALLIGLDIGGLRHLVTTVDGGLLAAFLLVFFNGIVFSGIQFGVVVMTMDYPDTPPKARPKRPTVPTAVSVRSDSG